MSKTAEEILKEESVLPEIYPALFKAMIRAMELYAQQREDAILDKAAEVATVESVDGEDTVIRTKKYFWVEGYRIQVNKQSILNLKSNQDNERAI